MFGSRILMKRLLLSLLSALALPTAVNAESYWLVINFTFATGSALEKIEMPSIKACKEEGEKWINSPRIENQRNVNSYHCVTGK